jgi:hypothetical protein
MWSDQLREADMKAWMQKHGIRWTDLVSMVLLVGMITWLIIRQ